MLSIFFSCLSDISFIILNLDALTLKSYHFVGFQLFVKFNVCFLILNIFTVYYLVNKLYLYLYLVELP